VTPSVLVPVTSHTGVAQELVHVVTPQAQTSLPGPGGEQKIPAVQVATHVPLEQTCPEPQEVPSGRASPGWQVPGDVAEVQASSPVRHGLAGWQEAPSTQVTGTHEPALQTSPWPQEVPSGSAPTIEHVGAATGLTHEVVPVAQGLPSGWQGSPSWQVGATHAPARHAPRGQVVPSGSALPATHVGSDVGEAHAVTRTWQPSPPSHARPAVQAGLAPGAGGVSVSGVPSSGLAAVRGELLDEPPQAARHNTISTVRDRPQRVAPGDVVAGRALPVGVLWAGGGNPNKNKWRRRESNREEGGLGPTVNDRVLQASPRNHDEWAAASGTTPDDADGGVTHHGEGGAALPEVDPDLFLFAGVTAGKARPGEARVLRARAELQAALAERGLVRR
jgi:hypothetical protein